MDKTENSHIPMIGAEVFIEPGQSPEEIDLWFQQLQKNGMKITRIRMFESYMHKADGSWDFSLFDTAFRAGEKYDIKIYANLFPATDFTDVGGFKFPKSEANLEEISSYIQHLVPHFKQFTSLYGWVPINEPGSGVLPEDEHSLKSFEDWKAREVKELYNSQGFTTLDFRKEKFLLYYNTWFLNWLTQEIHLYDPDALIHVNNHAIFQHAAEYNFPQWRSFLSSLGGSAHASWHFGYFSRHKYAVAMSANSEMLRSGAGPLPWLMTELQGGNNIYSAFNPLCPTPEEIAQWLWITIGSGSKGSIFWCLNPRRSGFEAGEWAMLNYLNEPSYRMRAASEVIKVINEHADFFSEASVAESGIHILYTRESMWIEQALQVKSDVAEPGRDIGGVMKSALAWFEAITEMGVSPCFNEIGEFDFLREDYAGEAIILAHQISIPSRYWNALESFVEKGGHLIAEGLTAYYDENAFTLMGKDFPFQKLFGGVIKEFILKDRLFELEIENHTHMAHLWYGIIHPVTGQAIAMNEEEVLALRNTFGQGKVLWIPSLIGLGSRITDDYHSLVSLLNRELGHILDQQFFRFSKQQAGLLMKTLQHGKDYLSILINKSQESQEISIQGLENLRPVLWYANKKGTVVSKEQIQINREETLLIRWVSYSD
ncbi:beta-galactosidase trimerization domain-containing protein [Pedobacter sp.]|jgi:beta-galactosidase|uniref:beta-galactosidase trimerization domain-containing protein n=1 Tax=Pedobacter sp. TaxID=1411316 RepID=UPI002BC13899|nr:beta-galactosidase trimerization domain-containing protein [Pedobacter sp.]HWW38648.1 beta-galactosidase trimerization domain-containing protein [Pedobacter sp.]